MEFKTGQHIISYGIGMSGVVMINVIANPGYGIIGYVVLVVGLILLGVGGILEGSIKE
jgi:hypothetical protein